MIKAFTSAALMFFSFLTIQKQITLNVLQEQGSSVISVILKSASPTSVTLLIFDATGKYVYMKNYSRVEGETRESIDFSKFPKGVYIFELEGNEFRETRRVVFS